MPRARAALTAATLALLGTAAAPRPVGAADYDFTLLYDTSEVFTQFGLAVLNDNGQVAFTARRSADGVQAVYLGGGAAPPTLIAVRNPVAPIGFSEFLRTVDVNNSGTVLFEREVIGAGGEATLGVGDFTGTGGTPTALTGPGTTLQSPNGDLVTGDLDDAGTAYLPARSAAGGSGIFAVSPAESPPRSTTAPAHSICSCR